MADPNRALFESVVRLLAPVLDELVFVGGCTTGLFITDPAAGGIRPTKDVDAIVDVTSYAKYTALSERLRAPYSEYFGEVSRDGRWLLFTSDQSGRDEIYVTSYPTPGVMHKVSGNGGHKAAWNGISEIVTRLGLSGSLSEHPGVRFRRSPGRPGVPDAGKQGVPAAGDDAHRYHQLLR